MKSRILVLGLALASTLSSAPSGGAATWYVAPSGSDAADGTTWATAKQTIQAAIDVTVSNDTVLVSNGVYATGSRTVFSSTSNRVAITNAITVQSVNGPDVTFIVGAQDPVTSNGNASIRCVYMALNSFLSGFTLTNGHTRTNGINGIEINGGGVFCGYSAVVSNCVFTGNSAFTGGGSFEGNMYDCTYYGNRAGSGGGSHNGDMYRCTYSNNAAAVSGGGSYFDVLYDCSISNNTAAVGGGMYGSSLYNCTVAHNTASQDGGGSGSGALTECLVFGNTAGGRGGGAFGGTLSHCTLFGNSATNGGGMYSATLDNCVVNGNSAFLYGGGSSFGSLKNCTVTGNTAGDSGGGMNSGGMQDGICYFNTAPNGSNYLGSAIQFSCTAPFPGNNCITVNPGFVDAAASNFHLSAGSSCIDTGSNFFAVGPTDRDGNPRILNGTIDMGAFEFQYNAGYWLWAGAITNSATNYSDSASGDGYANLLKYATGSSPTNADTLAAMTGTLTNGIFTLEFHRNTNAIDVSLFLENSTSLVDHATWNGIVTNINGSWGIAPNVTETGPTSPVTVTVTVPAGTISNTFLRLRVARP